MSDDKPIIIIKKKSHHGGHHGGAWKVAYADFVTAMMAFFMVMWLLNQSDQQTKKAIASYFKKPGIFEQGSGTPLEIGGAGILDDSYAPPKADKNRENKWELRARIPTLEEEKKDEPTKGNLDKKPEIKNIKNGIQLNYEPEKPGKSLKEALTEKIKTKSDIDKDKQKKLSSFYEDQTDKLDMIAKELERQIMGSEELKKLLGELEVKVEADGIVIEIMDTDKTSMFLSGSARILPEAENAFKRLSTIIAAFPNTIDIIGHTDSKPFSRIQGGFSNWELSSARANSARKVLEASGLSASRITSVVGKADRELKKADDPYAASNRRITIKMRFDLTQKLPILNSITDKKAESATESIKDALEKKTPLPPLPSLQNNQPSPPSSSIQQDEPSKGYTSQGNNPLPQKSLPEKQESSQIPSPAAVNQSQKTETSMDRFKPKTTNKSDDIGSFTKGTINGRKIERVPESTRETLTDKLESLNQEGNGVVIQQLTQPEASQNQGKNNNDSTPFKDRPKISSSDLFSDL
jgi:chemotaxis protein MotB